MSALGKIFKIGLNAITPKYSKAFAEAGNTGLKKFLNGTRMDYTLNGRPVSVLQTGLKHRIVMTGYKDTLNEYSQMVSASWPTGKQLVDVKNRVPRCLQNALSELAWFKDAGANIVG